MKRIFGLALATLMIASAASLQAENKKDAPVYDPLTWKADTIQGIAGYTVAKAESKSRRGEKKEAGTFLPMKDLTTGQILGKLQPVSISDYSRGWSYIETAPANTSMADNSASNKNQEKKD